MEHMANTGVVVTRQDCNQAIAKARDHLMVLNIKKGNGEGGFTAAETLLAALGACLLTNVNAIGEKMRLKIEGARVEVNAIRLDDPPALTDIYYHLVLVSSEPVEKLNELHELCVKWGTVTNSLLKGLDLHGELLINK